MKSSRSQVHTRLHKIPLIKWADQQLTSYAGLIVFQVLFRALRLKQRLTQSLSHLKISSIYGPAVIVLLLIVHLILGFRRLRGIDYYRTDPLVGRVLGLRQLPDVATVSRSLSDMDAQAVENLRTLNRTVVLDRLVQEQLASVCLDFDGSVQSTTGHAEGTAVGYNKKKKGARSYYPLFCTVSDTGQFLDLHHRPGAVHDSNGAPDFMTFCVGEIHSALPKARLEARIDSAFFNDQVFPTLEEAHIQFTCSVPFERFPELKKRIENRHHWNVIDDAWSYFEDDWKPKSWDTNYRFLFLRQKTKKQEKGVLQLDLFRPIDHDYEYKVIATNKTGAAKNVLLFHNGRGTQERLFAEAKQHAALDLIPTRTLHGNQVFAVAGLLTHNLTRELQMRALDAERKAKPKRPARWPFLELGTLRQRIIHLAGRLIRPAGELTLVLNDNETIRKELTFYMQAME